MTRLATTDQTTTTDQFGPRRPSPTGPSAPRRYDAPCPYQTSRDDWPRPAAPPPSEATAQAPTRLLDIPWLLLPSRNKRHAQPTRSTPVDSSLPPASCRYDPPLRAVSGTLHFDGSGHARPRPYDLSFRVVPNPSAPLRPTPSLRATSTSPTSPSRNNSTCRAKPPRFGAPDLAASTLPAPPDQLASFDPSGLPGAPLLCFDVPCPAKTASYQRRKPCLRPLPRCSPAAARR
jgi:hypothetical protein